MNCRQCGNPLTGMETVCPNCGTPVQNEVPVVDPNVQPVVEATPVMPEPTPVMPEPTPVMPTAPVMDANPMVAPTPVDPNMMNPAPVQGMEPAMAPVQDVPQEGAKEGNNKKLILVITALLVILVGVMIYFVVFAGGNKQNPQPTPTPSEATEKEEEELETEATYGKWIVPLPEGATASVGEDQFLSVQTEELYISLGTDYTNSINAYLDHFASVQRTFRKFPSEQDPKRDYMLIREMDTTTNKEAVQYASPNTASAVVYTGIIVRKDGSTVAEDDILVMDNMIASMIENTKEDATQVDVGTAGVYDAPAEAANLK